MSEETRNRLRDVLPMLDKNIADLVQDTDSMQRVLLAIKSNPSPVLSRVLSSLSITEVQTLMVKKAQRNLFDRETLLAKRTLYIELVCWTKSDIFFSNIGNTSLSRFLVSSDKASLEEVVNELTSSSSKYSPRLNE